MDGNGLNAQELTGNSPALPIPGFVSVVGFAVFGLTGGRAAPLLGKLLIRNKFSHLQKIRKKYGSRYPDGGE